MAVEVFQLATSEGRALFSTLKAEEAITTTNRSLMFMTGHDGAGTRDLCRNRIPPDSRGSMPVVWAAFSGPSPANDVGHLYPIDHYSHASKIRSCNERVSCA